MQTSRTELTEELQIEQKGEAVGGQVPRQRAQQPEASSGVRSQVNLHFAEQTALHQSNTTNEPGEKWNKNQCSHILKKAQNLHTYTSYISSEE